MSGQWRYSVRYVVGNGPDAGDRFYFGDNLAALEELCEDPAVCGRVQLVYIDPPYATGQTWIGKHFQEAYSDKFDGDDGFLNFLQPRLVLLRDLLAKEGSIYIHIDTKIGHYVKVLCDKVFGKRNFRNEITRIKCNPKNFQRKAYGNIKDVILFYSKTPPGARDCMIWNDYREPLSSQEVERQFPKVGPDGRRYATTPLHAKGETRNGPTGQTWKGLRPPKGRHWRYPPRELTRLDEQGLIEWSPTGNPRKIIYPEDNAGKKLQDVWEFKDKGFERSLYPTEKNLDMLDRIVRQSSLEGGWLLDCFAGSGTTLLAAARRGRRWIGVDNSRLALYATLKRLTCATEVKSFTVLYPADYDSRSSALQLEYSTVEERDSLFCASQSSGTTYRVRVAAIRTQKHYRTNAVGLAFLGRKTAGDAVTLAPLRQRASGSGQDEIRAEGCLPGDSLIVFDIHGNEFIGPLGTVGRRASGPARAAALNGIGERPAAYGRRGRA